MSSSRLISELRSGLAQLPPGGLAVGFSGGLDSSVLVHALSSLAPARERGLRALHIDHGLHAHSAAWARHCTGFAAQLDIPFVAVAINVADGGRGIEEAARAARYRAFAENLQPGELFALAHHADDQAETVLLKLLRGAGPQGLAGMRALRDFACGHLWRPLLDLPRAALRDYAQEHDLRWIEDPSNQDTRLRRNFLRAEILPRLVQHWPDAPVAIAHSAAWARAAADFIDDHAQRALALLQGVDPAASPGHPWPPRAPPDHPWPPGHLGSCPATLDWRGWLDLPDALRDPVLRLWLRRLGHDEPAHFHVAELERQLRTAGDDRAPCVRWDRCELRRYRELLYAMQPVAPLDAGWQSGWNGSPVALPGGGTLVLNGETGPATFAADDRPLTIHYRSGGEHIKPAGSAHTRELRLLLQEAGIPPWQRDRIPLISVDGELIAVADLVLSDAALALCERLKAKIVWNEG